MTGSATWRLRLDDDAMMQAEPTIDAHLEQASIDAHAYYVARLVIEEIVRNLIIHTPPYASDEEVEISIDIDADHVVVTITDQRPPFDPFSAPPLDLGAPLKERKPGGMGLHLVRTMTDALRYEARHNGNTLIAVVRRASD